MKKSLIVLAVLFSTIVFAQNKNTKASLEVDGVCLMCKDRIEKACVKTKGVKSAIWNVKTHQLNLIFDARKTNLDSISNSIIAVGHDTKKIKATDKAYKSLHPCCMYREQAVQDDHK